jgi:hypothetical protein
MYGQGIRSNRWCERTICPEREYMKGRRGALGLADDDQLHGSHIPRYLDYSVAEHKRDALLQWLLS